MAHPASRSRRTRHGSLLLRTWLALLAVSLLPAAIDAIKSRSAINLTPVDYSTEIGEDPSISASDSAAFDVQILQDQPEQSRAKALVSKFRDSSQGRLKSFQESLRERLDSFRARSSSDKDETSVYKFSLDLPVIPSPAIERPPEDSREHDSSIKFDESSDKEESRRQIYRINTPFAHRYPGILYMVGPAKSELLSRSRRASSDFQARPGDPQLAIGDGQYNSRPMGNRNHLSDNANLNVDVNNQIWAGKPVDENQPMRYGSRVEPRGNPDDSAPNNLAPAGNGILIPPSPRRLAVELDRVRFDEAPGRENLKLAGSYDNMNYMDEAKHPETGYEHSERPAEKEPDEYELPAKKMISRKEEKHLHHHHYHHHHHEAPKKEYPAKQDGNKKSSSPNVQLEIHIKGKSKAKSKGKGKGKKKEKGKSKEGDEIYVKFKQGENQSGKPEKYSSSASGESEDHMDHKEGEYLVEDKVSLLNEREEGSNRQSENGQLDNVAPVEQVESRGESGSKQVEEEQHIPQTINTSEVPGHFESNEETIERTVEKEKLNKQVKKVKHSSEGLKKTSKRKEKKVTEEVEVEEVEEKKQAQGAQKELPVEVDKKTAKVDEPAKEEVKQGEIKEKKSQVVKVEEPAAKTEKKEDKKLQLQLKLGLQKSKHQHIEVHEHNHLHLHNEPKEKEKVSLDDVQVQGHEHQDEHPPQPYEEQQGYNPENHHMMAPDFGYHGEHAQMPIKEHWLTPQMNKPSEKHPLGSYVIEDDSDIELNHEPHLHPRMSYREEIANHPHGMGLSPAGVRPLLGAFSSPIKSQVRYNSTMEVESRKE